jgi:hypothetical protein
VRSVEIGSDLAPLNVFLDRVSDDLAAGVDHALAEPGDRPRVVWLLHQQCAGKRHVEVAVHGLDVLDEVSAGVAGVGALGRIAQGVDRGADELGPVAVAAMASPSAVCRSPLPTPWSLAYPVSPRVNNAHNGGLELTEPLHG